MNKKTIATKSWQYVNTNINSKIRGSLKNLVIWFLSMNKVNKTTGWISFPYYHHVFDDEIRGFKRQLEYFHQLGDFISLDEAVLLMLSDQPLDARYFCLTFDDGFKNCYTNAMPLLIEKQINAAFFLPTKYIGAKIEEDQSLYDDFFAKSKSIVEFMNWDDVKSMNNSGMTIGSHTVNHTNLATVNEAQVLKELKDSKFIIEEKTGKECKHFCCPWGKPLINFIPGRDPQTAAYMGYKSFLTTERGRNYSGLTPFFIQRDHVIATWGNSHLKYHFL